MNYRATKSIFIVLILTLSIKINAQKTDPPFLKYLNHPWVDSVLKSLSTEEKVAQLIWVEAFSNRGIDHEVYLSNLITDSGIGGLIFFQDQPEKQTEMINYFRKISRVPIMVVTDGEWGLGMRLKGIIDFPYQMTLGAVQNDSLIYEMGSAIAGQFRRAGVQINLAPVADINNDPMNPVINFRSFGENPGKISAKTLMYMKGLQDNGIISVAKHFPGHGDTEVDSHLDLPVLRHSRARLDSVELAPFRTLINAGIAGIMPGHLNVLSVDSTPNLPATLSYPILSGLLKNELSFRGLIISDAMDMGGITRYSRPGEAEVAALKAGIDVLEYVAKPEQLIKTISEKVKNGELNSKIIDEKCRKVLAAKYWAGLDERSFIEEENIASELSPPGSAALIRELYANALTVLKNDNTIIPVRQLENIRIAAIDINHEGSSVFQERLESYLPVDCYSINTGNQKEVTEVLKKLKNYDLVIAGIFSLDQRPYREFGITPALTGFIDSLVIVNKTIITCFGNPYAVNNINSLAKANGLLLAYQQNEYTEDLSAQLIFGGIGASGSLPVTINEMWPSGFGLATTGNIRMRYGIPESAGMSSAFLDRKIDSIVNAGLTQKAFPGCEVMVARKGIVIFHKDYGYHDYDDRIKTEDEDLFDLASVTKVTSALPSLMVLDGEGKFSPDETLGHYLPFFRNSNKGKLKMNEILTHQAGLKAWIPFWKETVKKNGEFKRHIYSTRYSRQYPLKVAEGLYISNRFKKRIYTDIKKSPLTKKKYLYSDLGFILAPEIVKSITGEDLPGFVTTNVYKKLGAGDILFNPMTRYPLSRIIPTEFDSLFRKQQLHGTVHDEGAAMLGGVSGHAGLFATANDLMKVIEMYRRMGNYGGEQIIPEKVLEKYTSVQFPENGNRRGLGFDKPLLNNATIPEKDAYPAKGASPSSFGHSGYTGTFFWVDPEKELCYIFLSNRVYPTRNNNLISDLNIRSSILQALYDSIRK